MTTKSKPVPTKGTKKPTVKRTPKAIKVEPADNVQAAIDSSDTALMTSLTQGLLVTDLKVIPAHVFSAKRHYTPTILIGIQTPSAPVATQLTSGKAVKHEGYANTTKVFDNDKVPGAGTITEQIFADCVRLAQLGIFVGDKTYDKKLFMANTIVNAKEASLSAGFYIWVRSGRPMAAKAA